MSAITKIVGGLFMLDAVNSQYKNGKTDKDCTPSLFRLGRFVIGGYIFRLE